MYRKVFQVFLSIVLVLGLMPGMAFAAPVKDVSSKSSLQEQLFTSNLKPEEPLKETTSGKWGACDWEYDRTTGVLTVYGADGASGTAQNAPWALSGFVPYNHIEDGFSIAFAEKDGKKVKLNPSSDSLFYYTNYRDKISSIDFTGIDTSDVTNMHGMFHACRGLTSLDLSFFDFSKVEDLAAMFLDCQNLASINLSSLKNTVAKHAYQMFCDCFVLTNIDLSGLTSSYLETVNLMFDNCRALKSVNLTGINTNSINKARDVEGMFNNCSSLERIDLGPKTTKLSDLPESEINGHTDWYSAVADDWFSSANITSNRLGTPDTYLKTTDVKRIATTTMVGVEDREYNRQAHTFQIVIKDGDETLVEGTDYRLEYANNFMPGTGSVTAYGLGDYAGAKVENFTIAPRNINMCTIEDIEDVTYNGGGTFRPSLVVRDGDRLLNTYEHYNVDYENNQNAGQGKVIVSGKDYYGGTAIKYFTIHPKDIDTIQQLNITGIEDQPYTGSAVTLTPEVRWGTGRLLVEGKDYDIEYRDNVNIGTAKAIFNFKGNYTGSRTVEFLIGGNLINQATVTGMEDKTYTGSALTQVLQLKMGDEVLSEGTDYSLTYQNNINAGTATLIIKGEGEYAGSMTKTFKINPKSLDGASITGIQDKTFTGSKIVQSPKVTDGNAVLLEKTDYTLSYQDNINPGTAKILIKGIRNYTGIITKTFTINPAIVVKPSKPKIVVQPVKSTTIKAGSTKPYRVSVKAQGSKGAKLIYQWYVDGKAVKGATKPTLVVNNPTSLKHDSYSLCCVVTQVIGGKKYSVKSNESTLEIDRPVVLGQALPQGKTALLLTWLLVSIADGYDIFFSRCNYGNTTMKTKKIKSIKDKNVTSYVKKNLLPNTCYKCSICPYMIINGTKYYLVMGPQMHVYTGGGSKKYTDPKDIILNKESVTLKTNDKHLFNAPQSEFQLNAKVIPTDPSKELISTGHAPLVRYESSDKSVAKVSDKGRIYAVGKGSCNIYAYTQNGIRKTCKVTVFAVKNK